MNVKFGTRLCQISTLSVQKCRITASKTVKIWNFAHTFAAREMNRITCAIIRKFCAFMHMYKVAFMSFNFVAFGGHITKL